MLNPYKNIEAFYELYNIKKMLLRPLINQNDISNSILNKNKTFKKIGRRTKDD